MQTGQPPSGDRIAGIERAELTKQIGMMIGPTNGTTTTTPQDLTQLAEVQARLAAVHEAGHVVACLAVGGGVDYVYIELAMHALTFVTINGLTKIRTGDYLTRGHAIHVCAGDLAAQMFAPVEREWVLSNIGDGTEQDDADLRAIFVAVTGSDQVDAAAFAAWCDERRVTAAHILRKHADWVKAIARALFDRGYLNGKALAQLIGPNAWLPCVLKPKEALNDG